jgi:dTDP-4-dehydrorhamnose 3,5-epimerase-like enzyme
LRDAYDLQEANSQLLLEHWLLGDLHLSRLNQVRLIARRLLADDRGWLLKVMDGKEESLSQQFGEIYLVMASAGQVRANHYHLRTSEWFTLVMGRAVLRIEDPQTGEQKEMLLDAAVPQTVFVPAGIGHAFKNPEDSGSDMMLIAYADRQYEPTDTIALKVL